MKPTNKLMKRLSLYLFLVLFTLQTPSQADNIQDFQIEGMSIGDSALDFFSAAELKKRVDYYTNTDSKTFYRTSISSSEFENYNNIMFHFKDNDSSFKIYAISAAIWFSENGIKNKDDCIIERNKIDKELSLLFKDLDRLEDDDNPHSADTTGKSMTHNILYWFAEGHNAGVSCYIFSKEYGGTSHLKVMVNSKEFVYWLNNEAYK